MTRLIRKLKDALREELRMVDGQILGVFRKMRLDIDLCSRVEEGGKILWSSAELGNFKL